MQGTHTHTETANSGEGFTASPMCTQCFGPKREGHFFSFFLGVRKQDIRRNPAQTKCGSLVCRRWTCVPFWAFFFKGQSQTRLGGATPPVMFAIYKGADIVQMGMAVKPSPSNASCFSVCACALNGQSTLQLVPLAWPSCSWTPSQVERVPSQAVHVPRLQAGEQRPGVRGPDLQGLEEGLHRLVSGPLAASASWQWRHGTRNKVDRTIPFM